MTTSADLRTRILASCLRMVADGQLACAIRAAQDYEEMTDGMLAGLVGRVSAAARKS